MRFGDLIMYIISTLRDNSNYGNRLQNFALSELLKEYGNVTTLFPVSYADSVIRLLKYLLKNISVFLFSLFTSKYDNRFYVLSKKNIEFHLFNKKYIGRMFFFASPITGIIPKPNYSDIFVFGSDQIWNPQYSTSNQLSFNLGSFCQKNQKISYAASLGQDYIEDDKLCLFKHFLPFFKNISVREFKGENLLSNIIDKDITVVLDPTLMLDTNQWNNITRGFVQNYDRYVLTYFLGKPSVDQEQSIQDYAKKHGLRIRRILDLRDKETYIAGPQDFVELFSKAQYVFTDSYHACCFSILYHKQFTVFNRAGMEGNTNMNSRMETLFRLFDLDSVVMDKGLASHIDYDKVDKLLAQHRAESKAWLDKAMEA